MKTKITHCIPLHLNGRHNHSPDHSGASCWYTGCSDTWTPSPCHMDSLVRPSHPNSLSACRSAFPMEYTDNWHRWRIGFHSVYGLKSCRHIDMLMIWAIVYCATKSYCYLRWLSAQQITYQIYLWIWISAKNYIIK